MIHCATYFVHIFTEHNNHMYPVAVLIGINFTSQGYPITLVAVLLLKIKIKNQKINLH